MAQKNQQFKENCTPKQQKGRRVPLQLRKLVGKEPKKLIEMGHI